MKQCLLQYENIQKIGWINDNIAKVNIKVKIKDDDRWWTIRKVYNTIISKEDILKNERNYLEHRKATDI